MMVCPSIDKGKMVYAGKASFRGEQAFRFGQVTAKVPSGHPSSGETLQVRDAGRWGISCGFEGWSNLESRGRMRPSRTGGVNKGASGSRS